MTISDISQDLARYRTQVLQRGTWRIGKRTATKYITLHWNGPAVPDGRRSGHAGVMEQLRINTEWQTRRGWANVPSGADGLQYHFVVAADGRTYQTRDEAAKLWHCGHATGNNESLAVHLLLGRGQACTDAQWAAVVELLDWLRARHTIPLDCCVGHNHWRATECPGPDIQARLALYRAANGTSRAASVPAVLPAGIDRYIVENPQWGGDWLATVREGPSRTYPVAGTLKPGSEIFVDALKFDEQGQRLAGANHWAHMARIADMQADLGFVHVSQIRRNADAPAIDDLGFVSPPRISRALFARILRDAESPAAVEADAMYAACADEGIDPALLLAFFWHESTYGKAGLCAEHGLHNPGNVRTAMDESRGEQLDIAGRGLFFRFASWELGARDWGQRMRVKYGEQLGLATVRAATPVYAPASDNNDPGRYAEAVIAQVQAWQRLECG